MQNDIEYDQQLYVIMRTHMNTNDKRNLVIHNCSQVIRFARMLKAGLEGIERDERIAQLGFNWGTAHGITGSLGGKNTWWEPLSKAMKSNDYDAIENMAWSRSIWLEIRNEVEAELSKNT